MRVSVLLRIFGGFLVIILVFAFLYLMFTFSAIKDFHTDSLARNLENLARSLELRIRPDLESSSYKKLDAFVKDFGQRINTRITVVDKEGVVLADSDEDPTLMNNHKFRPEISQALKGETGRSIRFSNTVKEEMLYVGIPVVRDQKITEVIRVSLYIKEIRQLRAALRSKILLVIFLVILFSIGSSLFLSRSISEPVKKLSSAFRDVSKGHFETRILLKNRDELGDLGSNFNEMTEKVKNLFDELAQKKDELSSILHSIKEGLLAVDSEDRIVLSNESLKQIIGSDEPEGKFYWEILRDPKFGKMMQVLKQEKENVSMELELNDRIFLCSAIYLIPRKEIVVTFHDLTQMKDLEKIKKDFIVNASHELRTPLTAIKGFVETLEEGIGDDSQDHLAIIKRNTDRLINIVNDLLLLSRLEEKEAKLEIEKVDVPVMVDNILKIFQQKIAAKNLELHVRKLKDIPGILGDPYKLEQMFINLFDNAVKYTEKGSIGIEFDIKGRNLLITIRDTGIGIPGEHLQRIFERFFVTDKARARKLGGTGLGLSIVKHIALLHGGEVSVESTLGGGTSFLVSLPVEQ